MAGETVAVAGSVVRLQMAAPGAGLYPIEFDLTYSSTNNETADVMEAGYLPPFARVYSVGWYPTDMDTGIAAVLHKVTVGSTDIVTGLTGAQTGTSQLVPVTSAAAQAAVSNAAQLVKVTTTTAAATGAAGTAKLVLWCANVRLAPT